jgi:hypothetical protein
MVRLRWGYDPRPIQRAGCPPWPDEQQTHPVALAIDSGKIAGGIEAKHDWTEELTTGEKHLPQAPTWSLVLSLNGPS